MKNSKVLLLLALSTSLSFAARSQDDKMLDSLPQTREEFVRSEKAVINTVNWLENTPVDQQTELRSQRKAQLIAWITNSPTVTLEINEKLVPFIKKNPELLIIFMGGWTKYSLENSYSKDPVQCNLAGIESAIKVYKLGVGVKKDKAMDKLVGLAQQGNLAQWVKDQLEKK